MLRTWPMIKSLVWKELRELLPVIVAAIAAECFLIGGLLRLGNHQQGYSRGELEVIWPFLYTTAVLYAVVSGLWQAGREALGGHYQFLLHRPLRREAIVGTKITFGAIACLLVVGAPLVWFAVWANRVVRDPRIADFSMPAWSLCAGILILYVAAFLSGLRPGRWYGSQFFPLLAGIVLYILHQVVADDPYLPASLWVPWLMFGLAIEFFFVIAILHVGRTRDFS
jgi:hypothetical protein